MNIARFRQSRFLTQTDCDPPILVTCDSLEEVNVAQPGESAAMKPVLHFAEDVKPLVLNWTNLELIADICGSMKATIGSEKKIVLYKDDSITFGGKTTGGIRVRAPKKTAAEPAAKPAPVVPF